MSSKKKEQLTSSLKANLARTSRKKALNLGVVEEIEKSAEKPQKQPVAEKAAPKVVKELEKVEAMKRTTIYIPVSLHKRIKQHCLDDNIKSMSQYLLDLVRKDLKIKA